MFTFLGGATFFFGPIIGAVLMVLAFVLLSEFTQAWLLYLGLVFMVMVMYAPGGIASLIMLNARVAHYGKLRALLPAYGVMAAAALAPLLAVAALVEMVYHRQLNASMGSQVAFFGLGLDTASANSWLAVCGVLLVGGWVFALAQRRFSQDWGAVHEAIERETHATGAAL